MEESEGWRLCGRAVIPGWIALKRRSLLTLQDIEKAGAVAPAFSIEFSGAFGPFRAIHPGITALQSHSLVAADGRERVLPWVWGARRLSLFVVLT